MILVKEYTGLDKEQDFVLNAFNGRDSQLFWSPTQKIYSNGAGVIIDLNKQLRDYKLYMCYDDCKILAFFLVHSISIKNHRTEMMTYVDPSMRGSITAFTGWVLILDILQNMQIDNVFAKIFDYNFESMKTAQQLEFSICGVLKDYIVSPNGKKHDVFLLHRRTKTNELETRWLQKLKKNL